MIRRLLNRFARRPEPAMKKRDDVPLEWREAMADWRLLQADEDFAKEFGIERPKAVPMEGLTPDQALLLAFQECRGL